jgi:RNA polymerase sigma-70 factor (ECF subfamily)
MAAAAATILSVPTDPCPSVASAYESYGYEIGAYIARAFGRSAMVEDVVQEAFARLLRVTAEGRAPTLVRPWLYRVAHNLAVDRLRRDRDADVDVETLAERRSSSPDAPDRVTSVEEIREALARVPEPGRSALLLAGSGYTGSEIARVLGRSEGATRTLLCRARRSLRALVADGGDPPAPRAS